MVSSNTLFPTLFISVSERIAPAIVHHEYSVYMRGEMFGGKGGINLTLV